MATQFATLGSCSSRNIFYSKINENYKSYFRINRSIEFVNMISMMSEPVEYDKESFLSENAFDNYIIEDMEKSYLDFLKDDDIIEYLIIDTFFDAEFNILILGKNKYMTESTRLKETDLYNSVKDSERLDIHEDFDEYFELWKKSYDKFFRFMKDNCPNIKIILNCSRAVYRYLDGDEISEHPGFKTRAKDNKYRNILDTYILENYDVDILTFDGTTFTDLHHIFGRHPTHYETRYYTEKTYQLNEIINRNETLGLDSELNKNIRKTRRASQIEKMKYITYKFEDDEEIKELNREINKLTRRNNYLDSELNAVLTSNSWKMTEPLRDFKRKIDDYR